MIRSIYKAFCHKRGETHLRRRLKMWLLQKKDYNQQKKNIKLKKRKGVDINVIISLRTEFYVVDW